MSESHEDLVLIGDFYTHLDISQVAVQEGIFKESDFKIMNFEGTYAIDLSQTLRARTKSGPSLLQGRDSKEACELLGIDMLIGANNHFYDFWTNSEISIPVIISFQEITLQNGSIRIWCLTEKVYRKEELDVKFYELFDESLANDFKAQRKQQDIFDVLVVHSGIEGHPIVSEVFSFMARRYVDLGFSAVIFNHNHVISPIEIYNGATICYGTGSFFMSNLALRNNSFLSRFKIVGSRLVVDFVEVVATLHERELTVELAEKPTVYDEPSHDEFLQLFFYHTVKNMTWPELKVVAKFILMDILRRIAKSIGLKSESITYKRTVDAFGENIVNYLKLHAKWRQW